MGDDEGGAVYIGDDVGDSEGFAAPRDAEKDLVLVAPEEAFGELAYGLGLVALRGEFARDFEFHRE